MQRARAGGDAGETLPVCPFPPAPTTHEYPEMATATVTKVTQTPQGDARVHLQPAGDPRGALVLGHGAGGGVEAPDLVAAAAAAHSAGFSVALVEQPYRVAGKRSSPAAKQLDPAWVA